MPLPHSLPPLPYAYDALEPVLDKATFELHHDKHHLAYVNNYKALLEGTGLLEKYADAENLLAHLDEVPADKRTGVKNNVGGHLNHQLYWEILTPGGSKAPTGALAAAIDRDFGSYAAFVEKFTDASKKFFGSGWVFLAADNAGKLEVVGKPGHDTPLSDSKKALLVIDVWEHAYYLKFQNRRPDFVAAFLSVLNWDAVAKNYGA